MPRRETPPHKPRTIDAKGRITLPSEVLAQLGWKAGDHYGVEVVGKKVQVYRFKLARED